MLARTSRFFIRSTPATPADPWGIGRAVQRGDEIPRVPMVNLSQRVRKAMQEGTLPAEEGGEVGMANDPASDNNDWSGPLALSDVEAVEQNLGTITSALH